MNAQTVFAVKTVVAVLVLRSVQQLVTGAW